MAAAEAGEALLTNVRGEGIFDIVFVCICIIGVLGSYVCGALLLTDFGGDLFLCKIKPRKRPEVSQQSTKLSIPMLISTGAHYFIHICGLLRFFFTCFTQHSPL